MYFLYSPFEGLLFLVGNPHMIFYYVRIYPPWSGWRTVSTQGSNLAGFLPVQSDSLKFSDYHLLLSKQVDESKLEEYFSEIQRLLEHTDQEKVEFKKRRMGHTKFQVAWYYQRHNLLKD
jgi:hypothetical protein